MRDVAVRGIKRPLILIKHNRFLNTVDICRLKKIKLIRSYMDEKSGISRIVMQHNTIRRAAIFWKWEED
jgi:hypothetical protein